MTRLGLYGGPRGPIGALTGKTAEGVSRVILRATRLGLSGIPRSLTGTLTGKTPESGGRVIDTVTRLGLYGGTRSLYGTLTGKTIEVISPAKTQFGKKFYEQDQAAYHARMVREEGEIAVILNIIEQYLL